ncbi:MAG: DUF503 domain-containing protein [Anaerolineae bacterium]|nr:DUF503 domain-containing protein [Anaerolineae bacterium]
MVIGSCRIELDLPGISSLKHKRSVLKGLIAQVHKKFHVAAAEVDLHDVWQSSTLGLAVVSTSATHAEAVLENVVRWIEDTRPDMMVVDYDIESLHM